MAHTARFKIGKPCEVWCHSLSKNCDANVFVPIQYFDTVLLSASHKMKDENVLVTIPVVM